MTWVREGVCCKSVLCRILASCDIPLLLTLKASPSLCRHCNAASAVCASWSAWHSHANQLYHEPTNDMLQMLSSSTSDIWCLLMMYLFCHCGMSFHDTASLPDQPPHIRIAGFWVTRHAQYARCAAALQAFLTHLLTVDLPKLMVLPKRLEINIPPAVTAVAEAAVGRDVVMRAVASAVLQADALENALIAALPLGPQSAAGGVSLPDSFQGELQVCPLSVCKSV